MSWRVFTHHTLKTLLRVVQVIVFAVVPAVLVWLQAVGLPRAFFPPLIEAAKREGLVLDFSRMRLNLLEGLVLDDVRLRAEKLPANNEVAVDRVAVSLDWRRLPRGKVELSSLDLRGAQLFLPVETDSGITRTLRLTKARARLMLGDGVVSVPLAQFNLQGVEITASGQIMLEPQSQEKPMTTALPKELGRAVEIMESIDFGEDAPVLELEFAARSGDTAHVQLPHLALHADKAAYHGVVLRDINLKASLTGGVMDVLHLGARDESGGALTASGTWNLATGEARAETASSLDPAPWLAAWRGSPAWSNLKFERPPDIHATLEISPGDPRNIRVLGSAECGPSTFGKAKFKGLSGGFAWQDGDFYASDVVLGLPTGDLRADVMVRPDDVKIRIDCRADPLPLAALLDEKAREGIRKMEVQFTDVPEITFEAAGRKLDPASLTGRGTLKLGRTSIHDSPMDGATADLSYGGLALTLSNITVRRPEGSGSGAFTYDFGKNQVRLDGIRSTMNPFNVLQWADPNVAKETLPYRFKGPPEAMVSGTIALKDPEATRLTADFNAPQGLDYDLLDRTLNFGAAAGRLQFAGRRIDVDVPSARLFGGSVKLNAIVATGQPGARQEMRVQLDKVNFETLTRLYFDYKDSQGVVSGRYDFSFVPGQQREMRGRGNLLVENGNVFAIPVLGPLSLLLDAIIPGTGYQTARRATCDFRVADGEIRTDNLDILGQGFSMIGQGSLFFIEDRMDFSVRVNAQGVPGLLLYPVSKLFEYVSDGKMTEPQWRPKILPKGGGNKAPAREKDQPQEKSSAGAGRNGRV